MKDKEKNKDEEIKRKKAEEKIYKVNRLYALLSHVNQAVVRIKDKQELLQKICNIAIKYGKFRLAWIGFVDEETKLVKPIAYSGDGSDYLKNIKISITDELTGKGPTGRAILERRSIIFNDLENNPDYKPWREQALKRGYRSSAAFPIWLYNNVIGALNIYAVEPDFFDKDEIKLLEEAALDISFALEKYKEEETLRKSEQLMTALFESIQDGISILKPDLTIQHVNGIMNKWYKKNLPLEGKKCYKVYHNADKPCTPCPSLRCMESGSTEWNVVPGLPSSSIEWIELFSYPIKEPNSDKITGVVEFVRDITERKKAEDEIRKLSEVVENSPEAVVITDIQGKIEYINQGLLRLGGFEDDNLIIGKSIFLFANEESEKQLKEEIIPTIFSEGKWRGEIYVKRKDGSVFPVEMICSCLLDEKGNPKNLLSQYHDITEKKKAEEELKKHRDHLEELVKERTAELEEANKELKRFNKLFVGREFRIKELKDKVKELEKKLEKNQERNRMQVVKE